MKTQELEEKIRRSSSFLPHELQKYYLEYAPLVQDELDVYEYMEQRELGLDNPEYWLARFKVLQSTCQYTSLVALIKKAKKRIALKGHIYFWKILDYENTLQRKLEKIYKSQFIGRRSYNEYQNSLKSVAKKSVRKIGQMEVYVDPQCQRNYRLQDYAQAIQRNGSYHKNYQTRKYHNQQEKKQLSFIARNQYCLQSISKHLLKKQIRKSMKQNRNSTSFLKVHDLMTPKKLIRNSLTLLQKQDKNVRQDSATIVYNKTQQSKKSKKKINDQFSKTPSLKKCQSCRQSNSMTKNNENVEENPEKQRFIQTHQFQFSFGRGQTEQSGDQIQISKDYAIIQSNSEDYSKNSIKNGFDSFDLGIVIHEIQNQKYQSQTFSEDIDSNQENYYDQNCIQNQASFSKRSQRQIQRLKRNSSYSVKQKQAKISLEQLLSCQNQQKPAKSIKRQQQLTDKQIIRDRTSNKHFLVLSEKIERKSWMDIISEQKSYNNSYSYSEIKNNRNENGF